MTSQATPPGATLHLGGDAYAHPDLSGSLVLIAGEPSHIGLRANDPDLSFPPLTPYPGNPRRGDQDAITASIRDLGLYRAVIVQRSTGHVLAGNHTLRALRDLGAERVPVTWVDVDDTRAAAIVARDNRTSDLGQYEVSDLLALLTDDSEVLALSGYLDADLDALTRSLADLEFTRTAGETPEGVPVGEVSPPIDLDGDAEKVTVTLDPGHRADLYALLKDLPYVRNVTNAHARTDG